MKKTFRFATFISGILIAGVLLAQPAWAMVDDDLGAMALLIPIMGIICTFGMPVAIIAIIFYSHHRRNKQTQETIRAMIEKGMPVTAELVAELKNKRPSGSEQRWTRGGGLFPGLVLAGIGTALLITGSRHSIGGWIVLFIGIAFLVVWLVERQNQSNAQPPKL